MFHDRDRCRGGSDDKARDPKSRGATRRRLCWSDRPLLAVALSATTVVSSVPAAADQVSDLKAQATQIPETSCSSSSRSARISSNTTSMSPGSGTIRRKSNRVNNRIQSDSQSCEPRPQALVI